MPGLPNRLTARHSVAHKCETLMETCMTRIRVLLEFLITAFQGSTQAPLRREGPTIRPGRNGHSAVSCSCVACMACLKWLST